MKNILALIISIWMFSAGAAFANDRQLLGSFRDWDAFLLKTSDGSKICYMISIPKSKSPAKLSHGNPFITITHNPMLKISNELNFVVGYNYKKNSEVSMVIDKSRTYKLFTSGSGAWGRNAKQDNAMAGAMKKGSEVVMKAKSGRGNATSYRFSLSGFTAAHNAITKACR